MATKASCSGLAMMNLRRQIMGDGERAFAIALRRQPGHVGEGETQPARFGGDERAADFLVAGFDQRDALRRLIAGGDFQLAFAQRTVGLQTESNFAAFQRLHALEGVRFFLRS